MKQCLICIYALLLLTGFGCSKSDEEPAPVPPPSLMRITSVTVDNQITAPFKGVSLNGVIRYRFSASVNKSTLSSAFTFLDDAGLAVAYNASWQNGDSTLIISPVSNYKGLAAYRMTMGVALKSAAGGSLNTENTNVFQTAVDATPKFPAISNDSLLTLIQKQTFRYFWEFGHPVSGMARERNTSGDLVTTGGTGFGVMSMLAAVNRGFITRVQARDRIRTMVTFLQTKATKYHGAFAHWINGVTGATIPFSANDNGADLVETSFLMMGLLSARQYFNGADGIETQLRQDITDMYNQVEWNWFRRNNEKVLYWHWSPDKGWTMNLKIEGWNECLVTYVLAAASPSYSIPDSVYKEGWSRNGNMRNGNSYYGYNLPLGPALGGSLFYAHYSFLGIDPRSLGDGYTADYFLQNKNHTLINREYCKANPRGWQGYNASCWGLTASDIPGGYTASSPTNDVGVIAPTAAIGSFPYTPTESMEALRYFYYTLGDKLWKEYGFVDAFSIHELWFASSFLAIDQGPQIVMIENHRSGLLWQLFTSCPEVKAGMKKLGFSAPYL